MFLRPRHVASHYIRQRTINDYFRPVGENMQPTAVLSRKKSGSANRQRSIIFGAFTTVDAKKRRQSET